MPRRAPFIPGKYYSWPHFKETGRMWGGRGGELLPWKALVLGSRGSQDGGPEGGSQAASWSPASRSCAVAGGGARPPASAPTLSATEAERWPRIRRPLLPPRGGARLCSRACRTRRAPVRSLATGPAPSPAPARSLATDPQSVALASATVYRLQTSEFPGRASLQEREKRLPPLFPEKVFSSLLREKGLRGGVG